MPPSSFYAFYNVETIRPEFEQTPESKLESSSAGPNPTNPVQPSHGEPTTSALPISASGKLPITDNEKVSHRPVTSIFPMPERYGTEPTVSRAPSTTFPLRHIQSVPSFPDTRSFQLPGGHLTHLASSDLQHDQAAKGKALFESLVYPEGEIPVFDSYNADSWRLIRSEPVATQKRNHIPWWKTWKGFSSRIMTSWTDAHGALLDSHFLVVRNETSPTGANKSTHVIRPIPLECLSLAYFNYESEVRKHHLGFFKRIRSYGPTKEQMYPLTIYHVAAKITRRHTIYTKTKTERNKWNVALEKAIESRKSQQDAKMLYTTQILNDGFFKIPPLIRIDRGVCYTGRVTCAAFFSFQSEVFVWDSWDAQGPQLENYIAIGCTSGIYVSKRTARTEDYSFRKILEFNEPNAIVAIPEFNKFLVHCESTLSSYPLDKVIRAYRAVQSNAAIEDLSASEERLSKDEEHVLLLKVGRIHERTADPSRTSDRIVVIYAVKSSETFASHVLEVRPQHETSQAPANYISLCPPIPLPEEPHGATCFIDKVAIYTSKAVYFVEPMDATAPHYMVPRIAKEALEKSKLLGPLQNGKNDKPKIVELVDKATVLGIVMNERDQDFLLVYDSLGYFVDQAGKHSRTDYYIEWECKATAFVRHGPHLLLFSHGYIEVRNINTGKLFRMVEVNELRLLRSALTEGRLLIGVMAGGAEADGSRTEKLVELVYNPTQEIT